VSTGFPWISAPWISLNYSCPLDFSRQDHRVAGCNMQVKAVILAVLGMWGYFRTL
jgi:hypothetical protein